MADSVITVEKISKKFDKNVIFEDCSASIDAGTVFGIVGLNGSGKTTFIRMLLGLLQPGSGRISVMGYDPWLHDPVYFKNLGVILDHDGFAGNMTIAENLSIFADAKGLGRAQMIAYVEEYWNDTFLCAEVKSGKKKVKYFSRGQKMQCAICRAFLSWPSVYFLDEPTVALDVDAIDHFYSLVHQARARGATVLISSHQLSAIEDLCDCVGMLHNRTISIVKSGADASRPAPWLIRCDGDVRFGEAIEAVCGFPAAYRDGAWHFPVAQAESAVPAIVRELASNGCCILEVTTDTDSLRDRIRNSRSCSSAGGNE
jgi:ABC-type multidrug transport system ATPase subunit